MSVYYFVLKRIHPLLIELKINKLDIKDIGQLEFYINYYDDEIRKEFHNKTIGIIISKKDNKFVIEYASDKRIFNSTYVLN